MKNRSRENHPGGRLNKLTLESRLTLNNGVTIPLLGLGTYQIPSGKEVRQAVLWALEAGYRHIDTARIYGNEADIGKAVRESGIPRDQLFITSKLWNTDQGFDKARSVCHESLDRLGLEVLDLYLIHWPVEKLRLESWRALESLLEESVCRAIGVSNFLERHLHELLDQGGIVPAVNQVEFSPYLYLDKLHSFCRSQGIQLESYSPLTKGRKLQDPRLLALAKACHKTPAQILIRWTLQKQVVVIPKSADYHHIHQNADVFDFTLSETDMAILDGFHQNLRTSWDPTSIP